MPRPLLIPIVRRPGAMWMKSWSRAKRAQKLIRAFAMLENKVAHNPKRKHGNIPL